MKFLLSLMIVALLISPASAQATKVAIVKILKGDVSVLTIGKTQKLKMEDWVEEGSVVKTAEKSFVKLVFVDKSQMNVGPNSEMKIEKFSGGDSGVIDMVKGKIRSQVTKDYLQNNKSKLFIKTPNAVMGIRGTDFMITSNGQTTSAVLFEGSVVFNKFDRGTDSSTGNLENIVNSGVRIHPGEFSVMERDRPMPTMPAYLNVHQLEKLEKNQTFEGDRVPSAGIEEAKKSVVPVGLSGTVVSNNPESLKTEVAQITKIDTAAPAAAADSDTDGFIAGDKVKPANGSFVHIESGVIIPPGPGSVLDKNTNTYIPAPDQGQVNANGDYVPPKNVEITNDGKILVAFQAPTGEVKVQEIERPKPIASSTGVGLGNVAQVIQNNPSVISAGKPVTNDILTKTFAPSGLNDLSNFKNNTSGGINSITDSVLQKTTTTTTINVNE